MHFPPPRVERLGDTDVHISYTASGLMTIEEATPVDSVKSAFNQTAHDVRPRFKRVADSITDRFKEVRR